MMGTPPSPSSSSQSSPAAYIINVSSREGIPEDTPQSSSKAGHHVHTNMSKAAINMITETGAQAAWKGRRVAMNSVDPGYMSAAPECVPVEGCPIGFGDGAARVLWPVAVGEVERRVVWGRFLKHFRVGVAITQRGRVDGWIEEESDMALLCIYVTLCTVAISQSGCRRFMRALRFGSVSAPSVHFLS